MTVNCVIRNKVNLGFWAIQVNVILCEKRRRERGKKREKEREKKKRKRREKIWIRISKNHEDIFHLVHALIHPRQYSKYEDDNNDKRRQIYILYYAE